MREFITKIKWGILGLAFAALGACATTPNALNSLTAPQQAFINGCYSYNSLIVFLTQEATLKKLSGGFRRACTRCFGIQRVAHDVSKCAESNGTEGGQMNGDVEKWKEQLEKGEITQEEFDSLVRSQEELADMDKLEGKGN